ncbi:ornithine carbamoyltransferase [Sphaerotilaceae bacterium SBD11-9]
MATLLKQTAQSGPPVQALRGKNLAVLCESPDCPELESLRRAAGALGARVTHVRPSEALIPTTASGPDAVGSLLGRLYDAIDCHGLAPEVVERLARSTGRPVFNELACQGNVRSTGQPGDDFTLQALLLSAVA